MSADSKAQLPFLVIITGAPCSGKTTLGLHLATDFRLPFYNKDSIKELLFDRLGWGDREWSKLLSLTSYDLLYYLTAAQLKARKDLIVEANFKVSVDSQKFQHLDDQYGFRPIQFYCHAVDSILIERFKQRAGLPERHPGHIDHLTVVDLVSSLGKNEYYPLKLRGPVIDMDTTDFSLLDYRRFSKALANAIQSYPEVP